jgi:transcriptional regulator with XRE-family HTH domain
MGDRPHLARRRRAAELRARGLSLAAIGRALGCSRQMAHYLLRAAGVEAGLPVPVRCPSCGGEAGRLPAGYHPPAPALCRACLARSPAAPFGDRLRACRVAAGLRPVQLARRAGVSTNALIGYEAGGVVPAGQCLAKLLAAVGPALVPGCEHLPAVPPPPLAGRLRACRLAAGMRQGEAAARCGMDPARFCAYERGRRLPCWRTLCRLVEALGPGLLAAE